MDFREISVILISNLTSPSVNFFQYTSGTFLFDKNTNHKWTKHGSCFSRNSSLKIILLARKNFTSQTKSKIFPRHVFQNHESQSFGTTNKTLGAIGLFISARVVKSDRSQ
ncbi:hypothetical protein Pgin01_01430 [Porphyromonas gingivalis]|uniref:DUF1661 domain-containing protein n=1 Tax=Porphyromonas gingivalis TaxID=837 RepID=UPI00309E492B